MRCTRIPMLVGLALAFYIVGGGLFLTLTTLPDIRSGMVYLQLGEQRLFTDPTEAQRQFSSSAHAFESASSKLRSAPFALKLLTPLPPFRWYVSLIKAAHSFSEAGTSASALSGSFPVLVPEGPTNLNELLTVSTTRYALWYESNKQSMESMDDSLDDAHSHLLAVPSWITFGGRHELDALREQAHAISKTMTTARSLSDGVLTSLGSEDKGEHRWLLLITDNGKVMDRAYLSGNGGHLTGIEWLGPFPSETRNDLFPIMAKREASHAPKKTDGVLSLDSMALKRLLAITGPLRLSEANINVSPSSLNANSFSTPALAELFPALLDGLGKPQPKSEALFTALGASFEAKSLQVWTPSESLQIQISSVQPLDQPAPSSWLKIVPTGTATRTEITQSRERSKTLKNTLVISGAGPVTVYLPREANSLTGGDFQSSSELGGYLRLEATLPATITYVIPDSAENRQNITVLNALGRTEDTVRWYGNDIQLKNVVTLTR